MKTNTKGLKSHIKWFNELDNEKKEYVKKYINFNCIYGLDDDDFSKFIELRNLVIDLISDLDKENLIKKLNLAGLNAEISSNLYEHCENNFYPIMHSRIVKSLSLDKLNKIVNFVIEKMFIYYDEYNLYPLEYFAKSMNIANIDDIRAVMSFLFNTYYKLATKSISLETQKRILEKVYEMDKDYIDVIINCIKDKMDDVQKSYILNQMKKFMQLLESDDESNDNNTETN